MAKKIRKEGAEPGVRKSPGRAMKARLRQILLLIIALSFTGLALPSVVSARESYPDDSSDYSENDLLLSQYIEHMTEEMQASQAAEASDTLDALGASTERRADLSKLNQALYDGIRIFAEKVAKGGTDIGDDTHQITTENIDVSIDDIAEIEGSTIEYSAYDLQLERIVEEQEGEKFELTETAVRAAVKKYLNDSGFSTNGKKVLDALYMDVPYYLYWQDRNTASVLLCDTEEVVSELKLEESDYFTLIWINNVYKIRLNKLPIYASLPVAGQYQYRLSPESTDESNRYIVDTDLTQKANKALSKAVSIKSAADKINNNFEKLAYYRSQICALAEYDSSMERRDGYSYADPWQVINVFDDDPDTKTGSEGYARAFKLLCDLTPIDCHTVYGVKSGGGTTGSYYMWNLVDVDDSGTWYHVDVTDCDAGKIGADDRLFLRGASALTKNSSYRTKDYTIRILAHTSGSDSFAASNIKYSYASDILSLYSDKELTISETDYDNPDVKTITIEFDLISYEANVSSAAASVEPSALSLNVREGDMYGNVLPTPTANGYVFTGWHVGTRTESPASEKIEQNTAIPRDQASITLYAWWDFGDIHIVFDPVKSGATLTSQGLNSWAKDVSFHGYYGGMPVPELTGYIFDGWFTKAAGGLIVKEDTTVTTHSAHSLYAHWTARSDIVVTFEPGSTLNPIGELPDGTEAEKMFTYDASYGSAYGTNGSLPTPSRKGYRFDGWFTDEAGGAQVTNSTIVTDADNHTLYAHWTLITTNIVLNANGGKIYGRDIDTSITRTWQDPYGTLPGKPASDWEKTEGGLNEPEDEGIIREGYKFLGWFTASVNGTRIEKDTIVTTQSSVTLYAHWRARRYTVTFDPGENGEFKGKEDADNYKTNGKVTRIVTYGSNYGELPAVARKGYDLTNNGWYTTDGRLIPKSPTTSTNQLVTIAADHTLTARWTKRKFTVTFDGNGGYVGPAQKALAMPDKAYEDEYGDVIDPSRTGYTFDGWYKVGKFTSTGDSVKNFDKDAEENIKISSSTKILEEESHTIYAHWTANQYEITYKVNRENAVFGSVIEEKFDRDADGNKKTSTTTILKTGADSTIVIGAYDETYPLPKTDQEGKTTAEPTVTGYDFVGWYTLPEDGTAVTATTQIKTASDHTLYGHWRAKTFQLTLDPNGGTLSAYESNISFDQTYSLPDPYKSGYTFAGWYDREQTEENKETAVRVSSLVVQEEKDVTLYAWWNPNTYRVTLSPEGGILPSSATAAYDVKYNQNYGGEKYPETLPTPVRTGYSFLGWYTGKTNDDRKEATDIYLTTGNETLYAHWEIVRVTGIKLNQNYFVLPKNNSAIVRATIAPENAFNQTIEWTSQNPGVAVVTGNQKSATITAKGRGQTDIFAVTKDGNFKASCHIVVTASEGGGDEEDQSFQIKEFQDSMVYTGSAITQSPLIYYEDILLQEGLDYTVSYKNNVNIGTAQMIITGKGNYSDRYTRDFEITQVNIADTSYAILPQNYTGKVLTPKASITWKGRKLAEDKDYTLKYTEGITEVDYAVGRPITIIGKGNFTGETIALFKIYEKGVKLPGTSSSVINLKKGSIVLEQKSYVYTGSYIEPVFTVYSKAGGKGDEISSDKYTVACSKHLNKGTATLTVTGKESENTAGSLSAKYKITPLSLKSGAVQITVSDSVIFAKGGAKPYVTVTCKDSKTGTELTLREGVDYTLKYSNNKTATQSTPASVTIKGIGNFTDSITKNYRISTQDISNVILGTVDKAYNAKKKGQYYESAPIVYDLDGSVLKKNQDYTVVYRTADGTLISKNTDLQPGSKINVTITGTGKNYTGSKTGSYYIRTVKNISKIQFDPISDQSFTGYQVRPQVTAKAVGLTSGEDFQILGYYNNEKKGTGCVIVGGKGTYCGVKILKFKIVSAKLTD